MKDKWINIGYEGEELKPYTEPEEDFGDTKRIGEGQGGRRLRLRGAVSRPELVVSASAHPSAGDGRGGMSVPVSCSSCVP